MNLDTTTPFFSDGDSLGLSSWAAASGLSLSVGLALVASIHANVVGTAAGLCGENWYHDVIPPHVVCDAGDLAVSSVLTVLTSSLQRRQEVLVGRVRGFTVEELESAYHEGGFLGRNHRFLQELGNPQPSEVGIQSFSCESTFERDSEVADQTVTLENYLRPSFMLTGAMPEDVKVVASRSHLGRVFLGGAMLHLPSGAQARQKRVGELETCGKALGTGRTEVPPVGGNDGFQLVHEQRFPHWVTLPERVIGGKPRNLMRGPGHVAPVRLKTLYIQKTLGQAKHGRQVSCLGLLYQEGRRRRKPMTKLADEILRLALADNAGTDTENPAEAVNPDAVPFPDAA